MASIKVDADGVPYWEQPVGSHWDYTVDWTARVNNVADTVVSAVWSVITAGIGVSYYMSSKIFTGDGRVERTRIKVTVESWD